MTSFLYTSPKIEWGDGLANTLYLGYPLFNVSAGDEPRAGAEFVQLESGIEEAWDNGDDVELTADLRYIPAATTADPVATGYDGIAGFRAWLRWARKKNVMRFYPDAGSGTFLDCYLKDPMQGLPSPDPDGDGTKMLTITLRVFSAPPCFASATVGDGAWTAAGTMTRTPAAFMCADGVALDQVADADAVNQANYQIPIVFTGDGLKALRFRIAQGSAYGSQYVLVGEAGGPDILNLQIDFRTSTPAIASLAHGTYASIAPRGDGSWDVFCVTDAATESLAHALYVIPAGVAADTAALCIGEIKVWDGIVGVGLETFDGY